MFFMKTGEPRSCSAWVLPPDLSVLCTLVVVRFTIFTLARAASSLPFCMLVVVCFTIFALGCAASSLPFSSLTSISLSLLPARYIALRVD